MIQHGSTEQSYCQHVHSSVVAKPPYKAIRPRGCGIPLYSYCVAYSIRAALGHIMIVWYPMHDTSTVHQEQLQFCCCIVCVVSCHLIPGTSLYKTFRSWIRQGKKNVELRDRALFTHPEIHRTEKHKTEDEWVRKHAAEQANPNPRITCCMIWYDTIRSYIPEGALPYRNPFWHLNHH